MKTEASTIEADQSEWTRARVFLFLSAAYHLPLGVIGLLYNRSFPIGIDAAAKAPSAHVFGIFETNGWHSLAALVIGLASVWVAIENRRARSLALLLGAFHVGIVLSLFLWDPSVFWLASNTADQAIHSFTAIGGLAAGLATRPPHHQNSTK